MSKSSDKETLNEIRETIQVQLNRLREMFDWADKIASTSTSGSDAIRSHYIEEGLRSVNKIAEVAGVYVSPIVKRPKRSFAPPAERITVSLSE